MIVLYNPWSTPSKKKPLPMSLLSVASTLEGRYEYEIVDGNLEADPVGRILDLGRQRQLTAIGITVMPGPQLNHAVPDSRRLKAALPGVPIVWGGYFPSQHAETVLRDPSIDFCVRGQGEKTVLKLVETLLSGAAFSAIAGLSYREDSAPSGSIHHNQNHPLTPLDELPDWPYQKLPMERYFHKHYLGDRVGTHNSSYGCPFRCCFCPIVSIVNGKWVAQSPRRIEKVIRFQCEQYGADAVQFHDMDFFISEERATEFAERIMNLGISWWALGRIDELMRYSETSWRKIKASGLKMVFCGAESGSDEILKRMNKGGSASTHLTLELARRLRSYGVVPEFSFVLGQPPDPLADIEATIRFVRRLKEVNPEVEVILYMYTPVPVDGVLYEEARKLGFKFPETLDEWINDDWRDFSLRRDPHNPWLTPGLEQRVRSFERVLNAYYPTVTDSKIRGLKRTTLRALGGWRYRREFYRLPIELRAFQRLFGYQRPETSGF